MNLKTSQHCLTQCVLMSGLNENKANDQGLKKCIDGACRYEKTHNELSLREWRRLSWNLLSKSHFLMKINFFFYIT